MGENFHMTRSPSSDLLQDQRGPVLWLTINREARSNAISAGVLDGTRSPCMAAVSLALLRLDVETADDIFVPLEFRLHTFAERSTR